MKSLLVLIFFVTNVSGIILNETSLLLWPKAIHAPSQSQKAFLLSPQGRGEPNIGKIMYLKHLMELRCLKKTIDEIRKKNQMGYQQFRKPLEVSSTQKLQNQILNVKKTTLNPSHIDPHNKANPGNIRILFWPQKGKFVEGHLNKLLQNKTPQSNNDKKQSSRFIQPLPLAFERRKSDENFARENSRRFTKGEDNVEPSFSSSNIKNHSQPKHVKPKPPTHPVESHRSQQDIKQTRLFEVKEPFREELFDQKNSSDFRNLDYNKQNYLGLPFSRKKPENIKSSVTKISTKNNKSLGTLTKEIFNNSVSIKSREGSNSSNVGIYSDNDFSDLERKKVENKFTENSQEQKKQLKITLPYSSEITENSTERSTETTAKSESETNFTTTTKVENVKKIFATKVSNAPSSVLKPKKLIQDDTKKLVKNSEPTTMVPEIRTFTFQKLLDKENLDVRNTSFKKEALSTTASLSLIPAENEIKKFITKERVTVKMETNSPEEGLTKLTFTEFTDRPLTIGLLTTNRKDTEIVGKNSRKMHFNQQILTTTAPNQVSRPENSEQRRSDILIDDLDDYFLQESVFSLNYMKQLKHNDNINSSSEFIIQLIPFVINDLRENKISSEDIPILSKAFGDYWPTVLALTNHTNLDMLPLLKMKNEKDLSQILSTFFPEKSENYYLIATELKKANQDKVLEYYYEDDYTDLSKEQLEIWKNEETFKFK